VKNFVALPAFILVSLMVTGAGSDASASEAPDSVNADAQRASIEESRRVQTQRLDSMAKDCERRFSTTRCLEQVRTERLAIEGKLNRQEALLNDAQRRERGREQEERIRDKAAAHAEKLKDMAKAPEPMPKQAKPAPQPTGQANVRPPVSAKEPVLSVQERSAHAREYQRKQADALAKRAEVAKRLKDAGPKKNALPKPDQDVLKTR
jgi:hypothetical protein